MRSDSVLTGTAILGAMFLAMASVAQETPSGAATNAAVKAIEEVKDPDTGKVYDAAKVPKIIRDESSKDWVVDNLAGNSTAGHIFYPGPASEVGGLRAYSSVSRPDGSVYINGNIEVAPDGTLQVVRGEDGWSRSTFWDEKEQAKYTIGGNCIKKMRKDADGQWKSEVVAGTPGKAGQAWKNDGPAETALLASDIRGAHRTASGIFYWMESSAIRKLEDGKVTTLPLKFRDSPEGFQLIMQGKMFPGEDDDSLLVADGWNFVARRVNLKTLEVSNIAGLPNARDTWKPSYSEAIFKRTGLRIQWDRLNMASNGQPVDGPALTHATWNSGIASAIYDPFHKAIWVEGPDATCLRWLKDGWVKTVVGAASNGEGWENNKGTPGEQVRMCYSHVVGFDERGGVYFMAHSHPYNFFRAYNRKEVKP